MRRPRRSLAQARRTVACRRSTSSRKRVDIVVEGVEFVARPTTSRDSSVTNSAAFWARSPPAPRSWRKAPRDGVGDLHAEDFAEHARRTAAASPDRNARPGVCRRRASSASPETRTLADRRRVVLAQRPEAAAARAGRPACCARPGRARPRLDRPHLAGARPSTSICSASGGRLQATARSCGRPAASAPRACRDPAPARG